MSVQFTTEGTPSGPRLQIGTGPLIDASQDMPREVPKRLGSAHYLPSMLCCITHEPFNDPVMAEDGHCYERDAIVQWLAQKASSPKTGCAMGSRLVACHSLRQVIDEYTERLKKHAVASATEPCHVRL